MVRTSPFSVRLTREVRELIERSASDLRMKPSVLAAMILRDCTESWTKEYTEDVYYKYHGDKNK